MSFWKELNKALGTVVRYGAPVLGGALAGPLGVGIGASLGDVGGDAIQGKNMKKKNYASSVKKGVISGGTAYLGGKLLDHLGGAGESAANASHQGLDNSWQDVIGDEGASAGSAAGQGIAHGAAGADASYGRLHQLSNVGHKAANAFGNMSTTDKLLLGTTAAQTGSGIASGIAQGRQAEATRRLEGERYDEWQRRIAPILAQLGQKQTYQPYDFFTSRLGG